MGGGGIFLGSVYATFDLKTDGLQTGVAGATSSLNTLDRTAGSLFGAYFATRAIQIVGRDLIDFGKTAIMSAAELDASLSLLQAVTGATGAEMSKLRKLSIDLGNDLTLPGISASDAATAMVELGKAGIGVNDILGATKAVLQAAKAGNLDFAESAKIVANALLTFGLQGKDASHVADVLAAAANASSLEVGDIGIALGQSGAAAAAAHVPLEATVALIAEMANKGIPASTAAAGLTYVFRQLSAPTAEAAKTLSDLGLSVFDASGKFKDIRTIIGDFHDKLAPMTDAQRSLALNTIFGAEAARVANTIFADGLPTYDKMLTAVNKQNAANDLARARNTGLKGSLDALSSTFDTFATNLGEKVQKPLKEFVDAISGNFPIVLAGVAGGVLGLAAAAFTAGGAMITFRAAIFSIAPIFGYIAVFAAIGIGLGILEAKFHIVSGTLSLFAGVVSGVWNWIQKFVDGIEHGRLAAIALAVPIAAILIPLAAFGVAMGIAAARTVAMTVASNAAKVAVAAWNVIVVVATGITSAWSAGLTILGVAMEFALGPIGLIILAVIALAAIAFLVIKNWDTVKTFLLELWSTIVSAVTTAWNAIYGVISTVLSAIWGVIEPVLDFIKNLFVIQFGIILLVILTVMEGIKAVIIAVWNFISTVIQTVIGIIVGFITLEWNGIKTVIETVMNVILAIVRAVWGVIGGTIMGIMGTIRDVIVGIWNFIYGAVSGILNGLLNAVRGVFGTIVGVFNSVKDSVFGAFSGAASWLYNIGRNIIQGLINGIKDMVGAVGNAAGSVVSAVKSKITGLLGIHSPSTVFIEYGRNTMLGFALGISKNQSAPVNAMDAVTSQINASTDGLNNSLTARANAALSGSTDGNAPSVNVHGDIHINTPADDSRVFKLLTRGTELEAMGGVGAGG